MEKLECFEINKLTERLKRLDNFKYQTINQCNAVCNAYRDLVKLEILEALKQSEVLVFPYKLISKSIFIALFEYDNVFLDQINHIEFSSNCVKIYPLTQTKDVTDNDSLE